MGKIEISAVHKKKLEEFLKKLDLWERFTKGEIKCISCGRTISFENIGFIIPLKDKIAMCCSHTQCIFKIELQGGKIIEE